MTKAWSHYFFCVCVCVALAKCDIPDCGEGDICHIRFKHSLCKFMDTLVQIWVHVRLLTTKRTDQTFIIEMYKAFLIFFSLDIFTFVLYQICNIYLHLDTRDKKRQSMEISHSGISCDLAYSAKIPYFARTAVICARTDLEYSIMNANIEIVYRNQHCSDIACFRSFRKKGQRNNNKSKD
ncbi:hypothetical protein AB4K20DRAFT_1870747 [Rhizopus microsporus]|uniref:Uncharacterized protein n=1 Tax=Rhizopus microsporus TaxID=58291 RepID=A0A1X0RM95_RHIZD|nr:hypothetical protein BCV71DRAFT_239583 [Rhizopus microsporus]